MFCYTTRDTRKLYPKNVLSIDSVKMLRKGRKICKMMEGLEREVPGYFQARRS